MIQFNAGQVVALDSIRQFLAGPERFFCLTGPAGTGKTFVVQQLIYEQVTMWGRRVACTAPTNKAVKVLKTMGRKMGHTFWASVTYGTLHQILGLKMVIDQETGRPEFVPDHKNPPNFDNLDIILVDEGSMVNSELFRILCRYVRRKTKVIFIGDSYQLPPVGEECSPVFLEVSEQASLTEIMRHGSSIQSLVNDARENIKNPTPPIIYSDNDGLEGVWNLQRELWLTRMLKDFTSEEFQADSNFCRALAWRNEVVSWGNRTVHEAIYGKGADYFVPGQKLVANSPVLNDMREVVMPTSSECSILFAGRTVLRDYKAWNLLVETEEGATLALKAIDQESEDDFRDTLESIRERALYSRSGWEKKQAWDEYWELMGYFADVDYVYWLTIHKSQGSTFERVYIAYGDVKSNKKLPERNQCIYTALTRAAKQVIVQEY